LPCPCPTLPCPVCHHKQTKPYDWSKNSCGAARR
jgi:hypothetical protein